MMERVREKGTVEKEKVIKIKIKVKAKVKAKAKAKVIRAKNIYKKVIKQKYPLNIS